MPNNCAGGTFNVTGCCNTQGSHVPALVTNNAAGYSADPVGQRFNIPKVEVSTTANSMTVTVGGVPYTITAATFGTDIFLSAGSYNNATGILTLTLSNGSTIDIPIGIGITLCNGNTFNPALDTLVSCAEFDNLLLQSVLGWASATAIAATQLLANNGRTYTICSLLNALDTTTDASVPTTADVVYIRTDGTCGRAPNPAAAAAGITGAADSSSIDFSVVGSNITGSVLFDGGVTNAAVNNGNGIYVPNLCIQITNLDNVTDTQVPLGASVPYIRNDGTCGRAILGAVQSVTDSPTINLSIGNAAGDLFAEVIVSTTAGNSLTQDVNGLFVPSICTMLNTVDTATDVNVPAGVDLLYVRGNGTCGRAPLGGSLILNADGGTANPQTLSLGTQMNFIGGDGILTAASNTGNITFHVDLSGPVAGIQNIASIQGTQLYVPALCGQISGLDTTTDTEVPATADVVYQRTDGTCGRAPLPATTLTLTGTDTDTVLMTVTGGAGTFDVRADINIDLTTGGGDNLLQSSSNGLYLPPICTLLRAIDTATDASVPATADIIYIRADNTCGRAPAAGLGSIGLNGDAGAQQDVELGELLNIIGGACPAIFTATFATNQLNIDIDPSLLTLGLQGSAPDTVGVPALRDSYWGADNQRHLLPNATWTLASDASAEQMQPGYVARINGKPGSGISTAHNSTLISEPTIEIDLNLCTAMTALDTATDATVPATAEVIYIRADGSCGRAPIPAAAVGGLSTASDSQTIDFTVAGSDITGSVIVSGNAGNQLSALASGLFVPSLCTMMTGLDTATYTSVPATADVIFIDTLGGCYRAPLPVNVFSIDTDSGFGSRINITPSESPTQPILVINSGSAKTTVTNIGAAISIDVVPCEIANAFDTVTDASVPATAEVLYVRADGTCGRAAIPAAAAGGIATATDSGTIDFTVTGTDITAVIKNSATAGNAAVLNADGIYVPDLCTQITALDTATDALVPATADVIYITTGGICRRAPLPAPTYTIQDDLGGTLVLSSSAVNPINGINGIATVISGTALQIVADISLLGTNALTLNGGQLFVPNLCTQFTALGALAPTTASLLLINNAGTCGTTTLCTMLNTLDTTTDASVPATAEVIYVRADGTCGRAAIPAAAAGGITTATDSGTIDFTVTGTDITAVVKNSATAGNAAVLNADGIYVPDVCTQMQAFSTAFINNNHNLLMIDTTGGTCDLITPAAFMNNFDTATDASVPATADVVYVRTDGTVGRAPLPAAAGGGITTATDTDAIDFTITGTDITASLVVSTFPGNATIVATAGSGFPGVYTPDLCTQFLALPVLATGINSTTDHVLLYNNGTSSCRRVTPSVLLCDMLNELDTATDASVPATAEVAYVRADGTCGRAPIPAAAAGGITTATDSTSINFTVTGTDITGVAILDPLADNVLVSNAAGLYVPALCTQIVNAGATVANAFTRIPIIDISLSQCGYVTLCQIIDTLDTATDTAVPTTADVLYQRTDGTCGRAPLPVNLFSIDTDSGFGSRINITPSESPTQPILVINSGSAKTTVTNIGAAISIDVVPCEIANAFDTATDATVPATADILYVRADGTCGRAPAAAGGAITCATVSAAFPAGTANVLTPTQGILVSDGATCERVTMTSSCALTNVGVAGLVANAAGNIVPGRFATKARFTSVAANATLSPSTTDILLVNNAGGNITITLGTPAACEPNIFHIKQTAASTNTITLTPATGTIDGAATHVFGNAIGSAGESRMVAFDGTNWYIL